MTAAGAGVVPWLVIARTTALVLGALVSWTWTSALSEGLRSSTATAWAATFVTVYVLLALVSRWVAGLALGVLAGAGGAVASYALMALVAVGGSVPMSADAVRSGRNAMLVLAGLGLLHVVLAGASLMALLRALRERSAGAPQASSD